ncbi:phage scaffolding protein [Enterococcus timonensis]|uniref:phage scaffolding protein n=1 Tax=Enterococcus timonensis TaxID=1852364 RepID=UPI0008DA37CF|nr:phage scaffolding protein [Enterococcus timonensis]
MKREDLKKLGLTDEQIEAVITSHGQTVQSLNSQIATLQQSETEIKSQLSDRDKDLKKLQKDNGDNEAFKTQITDLQQQYKDLEKSSAEKLTSIQRNAALDQVLSGSKAKNPKAVTALLDQEKIVFKDGELSGVKEQIEALQKSDAYLFDMGRKQGGYDPTGGKEVTNYASFEEAMEKGDVDSFLKQQIESEENE